METFALLFLLAYAGGDDEFKQKLRSALDFYRENRELIQALAENGATMSETKPSKSDERPSEAKENRPDEGAGGTDLLAKFLGGIR